MSENIAVSSHSWFVTIFNDAVDPINFTITAYGADFGTPYGHPR